LKSSGKNIPEQNSLIRFLLKKSFYSALVLLGVVALTFLLFNLLPTDASRLIMGQHSSKMSEDAIRKELGLDQSLPKRFVLYLNNLSPLSCYTVNERSSLYLEEENLKPFLVLFSVGDYRVLMKFPYLGRSFQSGRKVSEIVADAFPQTFVLALAAMLLATVLGVAIGAWLSMRQGSMVDHFVLFLSVLGMAGPSFFLAIIVAWLFGFVLADYTGLNMTGSLFEIDDLGKGKVLVLKNLILPAFTLAIRPLALIIQLARNSFLEVLSQDYIRTARAKGLPESTIMLRHALPNALNPVVTSVSGWFAGLLAGAVFIEYIFGWHGLGKEMVDALDAFDFQVVMGCVLVISFMFVLINILVDIIYTKLDPRVKLEG
jgi:peptide/nickel transport system permease protein